MGSFFNKEFYIYCIERGFTFRQEISIFINFFDNKHMG